MPTFYHQIKKRVYKETNLYKLVFFVRKCYCYLYKILILAV
jgi:hypothetical protein